MNQVDRNIAVNLRRIRKSRNMSLDMLAELTGVSKSMLGQIERGESNPTIAIIGKIVEGLRIPFEDLLYQKEKVMVVEDWHTAPVQKKQEGTYVFRSLLPFDSRRAFEVYAGEIAPCAVMESTSHGEDTWEYVTVQQGIMELWVGESVYQVREGGSVHFSSDRPHSYKNTGTLPLKLSIILSHEKS